MIRFLLSQLKSILKVTIILSLTISFQYGQLVAQRVDSLQTLNLSENRKILAKNDIDIDSLLFRGTYYINLPGDLPTDIKKAKQYAQQALAYSRRSQNSHGEAAAFVLLSRINRETGDRKVGQQFAQKAVKFFDTHPKSLPRYEAYLEMAQYYDLDPDSSLAKKIYYQQLGVEAMKISGADRKRLADASKFLGDLYCNKGNYPIALAHLEEALALYKSIGEKSLQEIYSLIATALINVGDVKSGLKHHILAAKSVEATNDVSPVGAMVLNRLAITYNLIDEHTNALKYFLKARKIAENNGDVDGVVSISSSIISEFLWLKRPEEARKEMNRSLKKYPEVASLNRHFIARVLSLYAVLGEFKPAEPYYNRLLKMLEEEDLKYRPTQIQYLIIIRFLQGTKNFKKADQYIAMLEGIPKDLINLENRISVQEMALKSDSVQRDYASAVARLQTLRLLDKEALKRNTDEQISRLNIEFETQNKDKTLKSNQKNLNLLLQKNSLQNLAIKAQTQARNLSIGCACLLGLLLFISYYQYKIKKQANYLLESQKAEIDVQNVNLKSLVAEREWLLKEVHHRVKNNLQIVISLLSSQSMYLKDAAMLDVLRESQNRMNSISLIHQKLYQDENLSGVFMPVYIHELVDDLRTSFSLVGQIGFSVKVSELTLDVSQCVPLGLIINEAVTNAIKYAFTDMQYGQITIRLEEFEAGQMEMEIADNGQGLPDGHFSIEHQSLGINLMHGLSQQLGANLVISGDNGVKILMKWTKKESLKSTAIA